MVLLNVLLIALAAWLVYLVRKNWKDETAKEQEFIHQAAKAAKSTQAPALAQVPRASAAEYIDVAQKTLFSKDRNPNVEVVPPPPPPAPPPPKPVPPLPVYFGQMNLVEPLIVLSTERSEQKSYRKGDTVGNFKLLAFDRDTITLEFDDKELKHDLTELAPKAGAPVAQQAVVVAAAPAASAAVALGGNTAKSTGSDNPSIGVDMGAGYHGCVAGDNSPAGTVVNGYVKRVTTGLMGQSCHWEPVSNK
jgi:hypothetical protein